MNGRQLRKKGVAMEPILDLLRSNTYIVVIALICGSILVNSLIRAVTTIVTTRAFERSRQEIAAYIAEGSISAEQGERLLRARSSGPPMEA
jgi:hypothetical protein